MTVLSKFASSQNFNEQQLNRRVAESIARGCPSYSVSIPIEAIQLNQRWTRDVRRSDDFKSGTCTFQLLMASEAECVLDQTDSVAVCFFFLLYASATGMVPDELHEQLKMAQPSPPEHYLGQWVAWTQVWILIEEVGKTQATRSHQ